MMEFFQTALLALILSIIFAKFVSFVVSNPTAAGVCSVNEVVVAKEERGLRVKKPKGQKRVQFVDDVIIRRIDRYEEENGLGEDPREKKSEEQGFDERERHHTDAGSEQETLVSSGLQSIGILEEQENGVELDEKEGTGGTSTGERSDDDDDWEGIERSELEKVFAEAVNYVEYGRKGEDDHLVKLSSDVQMELYGLHKVAVDGPCTGPSPMPLKLYARAKWNAWQRHGSMSREAAMEEYIRVLSSSIPHWMLDYSTEDDIRRKLETIGETSFPEHDRISELGVPVDSSAGKNSVAG